MRDFWRKVKHQPLKVGIVCLLIVVASGMLVGGNVMAMQNIENTDVDPNSGPDRIQDALDNGQYLFSSQFDASKDGGVYFSLMLPYDKGEVVNRYLKDVGVEDVLGASRTDVSSVVYNEVLIPVLPRYFFQNNDRVFYTPGEISGSNIQDDDYEIVINQKAAELFNWRIGDVVQLGGNEEEFKIVGILEVADDFFRAEYKDFIDQYVNVPFIATNTNIFTKKVYSINELPDDATIIIPDKETGEDMKVPLKNDKIDFYDQSNQDTLRYEQLGEKLYGLASLSDPGVSYTYITIYMGSTRYTDGLYLRLQDILAE